MQNTKISLYDSYDPERTFHRGKPAREALYDLHTDILKKKQEAEEQKQMELDQQASQLPKLKESEVLRLEAFKREFRGKVNELVNEERLRRDPYSTIDITKTNLDVNHTHAVLHNMGFMQKEMSND